MSRRIVFLCLVLHLFQFDFVRAAENIPPELSSAIRKAILQHPDTLGANSEVLAARAMVKAGECRWYPKLEISSNIGESRVGGAGNRALSLGLKQPLWDGGRIEADYDQVKAGMSVASSARINANESIGIRVSNAYFNLLRVRELKSVAEQNVEDHRTLYANVSRRRDSGLGVRSDVSLAISRLQMARSSEVHWQGEVNRAEAVYTSLVNETPSEKMSELGLVDMVGGLPAAIEAAKLRSPLIEKLKGELLVAENAVRSKKAGLFPVLFARVDHTNYLGGSQSSFYQNDTRFSVNVEWQNGVALTQRYQVEAAEYELIAAKSAIESAERQIVEYLTGVWEDFRTARQRREELKQFEDSAAETVNMFKRQFTIGRRSWPEVMNAVQEFYGAKNQQIDAKYQVMTARMRLAFMTGELDEYVRYDGASFDADAAHDE